MKRASIARCIIGAALVVPCILQAQSLMQAAPLSFGSGTVQVSLLQNPGHSNIDIKELGGSLATLAQRQFDIMQAEWGAPFPGDDHLSISEVADGGAVTSSQPGMIKIATSQLRGANASRLLVNTIANQWWGVRVRPATQNDAWITNGMCRYAEFEYLDTSVNKRSLQNAIENSSASALAYDSAPLSDVGQYSPDSSEFQALTYDKGAMIFRMLRWQIGDAAFQKTLHEALSHQTISSAQIEAMAEAASNQNLKPFFTQWLDNTGAPTLQDNWTLYRLTDNKGYRTVGEITEDLDLFRMPVDVQVETPGKTFHKRVDVVGPETQFVINTPEIPKKISLDPDGRLLRNDSEMQVRVHILRGQNFVAINDLKSAIQEYEKALAIDSINSLASYRLGEAYFQQRNYQAAANAFRDALHGDGVPKWTEVWSDVELGKTFDLAGQRERAINQYREALQTQDNTGGALDLARGYIAHPYTSPQR